MALWYWGLLILLTPHNPLETLLELHHALLDLLDAHHGCVVIHFQGDTFPIKVLDLGMEYHSSPVVLLQVLAVLVSSLNHSSIKLGQAPVQLADRVNHILHSLPQLLDLHSPIAVT